MALSAATAAALVSGAAHQPQPAGQRVRTTRALCIAGARVEAGTELDVPLPLAREMRQAAKAEFIDAPAVPAPVSPAGASGGPAPADSPLPGPVTPSTPSESTPAARGRTRKG